MAADLSVELFIPAPKEAVWKVVSDLAGMGRRSPQCKKMRFSGPLQVGTKILNLNQEGWKVWPTRAVITAWEEPDYLAFRVLENNTVWSYSLDVMNSGTLVTERREAAQGTTALSKWLVRTFLGGEAAFEHHLRLGMSATLEAIRDEVLAAQP